MTASMTEPLADLTVVELSGDIATRYCGKLFAEHGARVIGAYVPADDRLAYGGASAAAYGSWLDAGKELPCIVPTGVAPDVVIAGQAPDDIARAEAMLTRWKRRPLMVGLSWFGNGGPRSGWQGSDAIVQALSGVAFPIGPREGPPTLPQGHAPQVVAGVTAFIAAMAALIGRRNGHDTGRVDTSVLEAFLCLTEHGAPGFAGGGPATKRHGVNRFGPVYPQTIFSAADGWIGVTALTPLQWQELCAMIGLPGLAQDPRYETTDLRMAAADELDAILAPAFHKLKAGGMLLEGQRRRIPLAPVPTMAEVLETPHWRERNSFRRIAGLVPFEAPTMPFRLHARGEGAVSAGAPGPAPLTGVRVLDLSMGWSGPLAARHFADLGAEVIKIEGCSHIDWWRGWNALVAADPPPYEMRANFNAVNRNKRGIAIELRDPQGADILRRLAVEADVLIENYAPGVLSRLGFSPEAMAKINPRISYISMGAFGSAGPWSGFRAYGSTTEQAAGMPFLQGAEDWTPTMQHTAYGDPIAGIYAAAALLTALWGRARTGGTTIDLSQVECLFQLAADGLIAQSVTGEPPPRKGSARATSLFRGCLRCSGTEDWLALDIDQPDSLAALSQMIGMDKSSSPEQIEPLLANWAARRSAVEAAGALQHASIAAAPVLPATGLLTDPHLIAIGFWQHAERRHVGMHVLPRAPYSLDGLVPPIRSPAPTLGQHNADVLQQILHMPRPEIEALERAGIIGNVAT